MDRLHRQADWQLQSKFTNEAEFASITDFYADNVDDVLTVHGLPKIIKLYKKKKMGFISQTLHHIQSMIFQSSQSCAYKEVHA